MEKITFEPLISEFQKNAALYNQWFNESEMKFGTINSESLKNWLLVVVEPVMKSTLNLDSPPEKVQEVVKAFYLESLKLIGSGLALRYKDEYANAWLLLKYLPELVLKFPLKMLSLLNGVLQNIQLYTVDKSLKWCELMLQSSAQIKTLEDFKITGRIFAWKCGLAHLRNRLTDDFNKLSEDLQEFIKADFNQKTEDLFQYSWSNNSAEFKSSQGGFTGTSGFFEFPPILSVDGDFIFVNDSKTTYAFFADRFGSVFLPANIQNFNTISPNLKQFKNAKNLINANFPEIDVQNISSAVTTKDTLIFSLKNSHFLYIFSLKHE